MYFPVIYPNELLYSAIARSRVHLGLENHKTLLNILFADTRVAAITDLPTHLAILCKRVEKFNVNELIVGHTLFPLYAPFITDERKRKLRLTMASNKGEGILGIVGTIKRIVKWPERLRYCPLCLKEHRESGKNYYWDRRWQILGSDVCVKHGCYLLSTNIPFRRKERHEYIAIYPESYPDQNPKNALDNLQRQVSEIINQIFTLNLRFSPTYWQWTCFYKQVASLHNANRGRHIDANLLWSKLASHQNILRFSYLLRNNGTSSPNWFIKMFQKHRISFSYLQHVLIWCCLVPELRVHKIFEEVLRYPKESPSIQIELNKELLIHDDLLKKREKWIQHLSAFKGHGVKQARLSGGAAMYAWLYRHDKSWLLKENKKRKLECGNNSCVDWEMRDKELYQILLNIKKRYEPIDDAPRRSKQWFFNQLPHSTSVRNHLYVLPLCAQFLAQNAESIGSYQVRRLKRQAQKNQAESVKLPIWELLRLCGLERKRLTSEAKNFVNCIQGEPW